MSSDYSLRCETHQVDAREDPSDPESKVIEHNGSGGYRAVRWAAEAGWLLTEALELEDGDMVDLTCWSRGYVTLLAAFAHEHAGCELWIMRDQGGGRQADERIVPRRPEPSSGPSSKRTAVRAAGPRPTDQVLDVDGMEAGGGIVCIGKATKMTDGTWRCLANVGGALAIVEVNVRPA